MDYQQHIYLNLRYDFPASQRTMRDIQLCEDKAQHMIQNTTLFRSCMFFLLGTKPLHDNNSLIRNISDVVCPSADMIQILLCFCSSYRNKQIGYHKTGALELDEIHQEMIDAT